MAKRATGLKAENIEKIAAQTPTAEVFGRTILDKSLLAAATALAAVAALVTVTTSELAAAEWQTADELRAQLIGNGSKLKGAIEGTLWSEKYSDDGTIQGLWNVSKYKGKWSFEGDMMCFDYKGTDDDGCWYIAIDGKKTKWWKPDGKRDPDSYTEYVAP